VPGLTLPKENERGIAIIKLLSDSEVNQISEVLRKFSPPIKFSKVISDVRPILEGRSEEDIESLVDTIYSLYSLRFYREAPIEEFLVDLLDAIRESDNEELKTINSDEAAALEFRLKSLLTARTFSVLTKAHDLHGEFANIFWNAKVISDIRPVWDEDVKVPPVGVVITQTLKLEYGDIEGSKELYLNVNEGDIELLISVLLRAREKAATLESLATADWLKILHE